MYWLDKLLLLNIGDTAKYLYYRAYDNSSKEGNKNNLMTIKAKDIPFSETQYSVEIDTKRLYKYVVNRELLLGNQQWRTKDVYISILMAFKVEYAILVIWMFFTLIFDFFVKYHGTYYLKYILGKVYGEECDSLIPGILLFMFKLISLLCNTHISYYTSRLSNRVIGAINGLTLSRLFDGTNDTSSKFNTSDSKLKISKYQNILTVDAEFSENAISYSTRILIYPLQIFSTFVVAAVTFDSTPLSLLLLVLSSAFLLSILALYISTLFKRPFIAAREERIKETVNLLEASKGLVVTQDHLMASFHALIQESRKKEMYYGSLRKYFFTIEEVFSRSLSFLCYFTIVLYVWYSRVERTKSIEMIIHAAWLVPTFHGPLQETCYFLYYISEGINSLNRLGQFFNVTRKYNTVYMEISQNSENNKCTEYKGEEYEHIFNITNLEGYHENFKQSELSNLPINVTRDCTITVSLGKFWTSKGLPSKFTINRGKPVIIGFGSISNNYILSNLLSCLVTGESNNIKLTVSYNGKIIPLNSLSEICTNIGYVPLDPWVADGMSISDIILCGREFDSELWQNILNICELSSDFDAWGISNFEVAKSSVYSSSQLSSGQKVRISLARALYGFKIVDKSRKEDIKEGLRVYSKDKVRISCEKRSKNCKNYKGSLGNIALRSAPIVILDSIFKNLDPPVCSNILSKLFDLETGILKDAISISVFDSQLLSLFPDHILPPLLIMLDSQVAVQGEFEEFTPISHSSISTMESIRNDYQDDSDNSRDIWDVSTNEDPTRDFDNSPKDIAHGTKGNLHSEDSERHHRDEEIPVIDLKCGMKISPIGIVDKCAEIYHENGQIIKKTKHEFIDSTNINKTPTFSNPNINHSSSNLKFGNKELTLDSTDNYGTSFGPLYYYIFYAANSRKLSKYNDGKLLTIKESSFEIISYFLLLLLPPIIIKFGEKILLSNLSNQSNTTGLFQIEFWYFFHCTLIFLSVLCIFMSGYLEVFVGLRAARYIHNSFLFGYINSKMSSSIRSLPISFILNRLNFDQLIVDYCTTKRIGQLFTAVNRVSAGLFLSIIASNSPVSHALFLIIFGILIYYVGLRYFTTSCRLIRNTYISEMSPLIDTVRNICDGKECIVAQNLSNFFLQSGFCQLQSMLKPLYIQSSLQIWLKLRLQVGIFLPVSLLNILAPHWLGSKTSTLTALVVATTYSSLSRIDEIVRYWTRLERELVSIERMRKYITIMRQDSAFDKNLEISIVDEVSHIKSKASDIPEVSLEVEAPLMKSPDTRLILKSVYAYHSSLDSQGSSERVDRSEIVGIYLKRICCLNNISAVVKSGEIIGIIGRSGSGKTSLLNLIANLLEYDGTIKYINEFKERKLCIDIYEHYLHCRDCIEEIDQVILNSASALQNKLRHIAMLPLEIFFSGDRTIRNILDPFERFQDIDLISALNICGISGFLTKNLYSSNQSRSDTRVFLTLPKKDEETDLLLDGHNLLNRCLSEPLKNFKIPDPIKRMLLFAHFFLFRNNIFILLIDEPPVIYTSAVNEGICTKKTKNTSLIPQIIRKYFSHTSTFIVAHDIRNLDGVHKFWHLNNGNLYIRQY
ncbi:uncharacterized protein CMU_028480 [Cryptosporidium muris RN66]|uniref:ABC transporter domain-containing protein n=1 Tax=Cryptosporidium muris (strain RN66) TaxID=441375 RepID=B6AHT3_CRYMR|nr:uncharacterized protein CMU_028480 [Cryptosporidium muris RN66]EEA07774.1 hypothetical protein, conserved [Cryptosporidium muris RN66]|eukprot:XP_002142123.1 hypothetical protein [Cryptosporidium muris RN66]